MQVNHPDGTYSYYVAYRWNGTMSALSGCAEQWGGTYFTAHAGDTIFISVNGRNESGTATLKASVPRIIAGS